MKVEINDLEFVGSFSVDSGQVMIGDPCYLDSWNNNTNDEWNLDNKVGEYSYQGASATTLSNNFGTLGTATAVVSSTGYGDGMYSVYAKTNEDNRVAYLVIDFEGEFDDE
jgi:hypothetical protein